MIYAPGVTSQSVDIQIVDDAGLAVTGLVAATFPTLTYSKAGANADVSFPALSDLAAITTAWASGGVKERGGGVYRLDCPDAAFAAAGKIKIKGEATNKHVLVPVLDIQYVQVDVTKWLTGTIPAVGVTGVPRVDVYAADGATALAELAQAQPGATPTVAQALMLLYMSLRNQGVSTSSQLSVYNNAGTVICKAALTDDGTTFTRQKLATGP